MDLFNLLKHLLQQVLQAIPSIHSYPATKKMSQEDLLESVQRELVGVRSLQTTIQGNMRSLDSKLFCLNDLVQQLVDQTEACAICCQPFSQPMKTYCGHVFCNHCITEWLASEERTSCPTCRETIALVDLSPVAVPAPTTAPAVEGLESRNDASDAAQQRGHTFASFCPRRSTQATGAGRQVTAAQTTQQTPARHISAQPHRNASSRTPSRSTRPAGASPNMGSVNLSPAGRPPRPLLAVLRSISSFGPTAEEREAIRSIFERAANSAIHIQAGNEAAVVKEHARRKWKYAARASPRIFRLAIAEKQKIAGYVEWLEHLVQRQSDE